MTKKDVKAIIMKGFSLTRLTPRDIMVYESKLGIFGVKVLTDAPMNRTNVRFHMKQAGFERVSESQIPPRLKDYDGMFFYKGHEPFGK